MRAKEFTIESTQRQHTLGGFPVKVVNIEQELDEFAPSEPGDSGEDGMPDQIHQLANRWWNNTDDQDQIANVLRSMGWDIRQADGEDSVCQLTYRDGTVHYLNDDEFDPEMYEAIKLDAPHRRVSRDELQGYADRIKTGTKTKKDRFAPIIHGSNIKAITKDDTGTEWDLDDLARQITTRPRAILGTNAKMSKSATEGEIVYDLTLPALSGIVVDEESGDFVEINTCPGAGGCQLFCYARKGGYVMFPASSMSAAQALNFLVNDPEGYTAVVNKEINSLKGKADKHGIRLVVRWHDAGDFFSKAYLNLAYGVANANPDVKFYAYTKIADVATGAKPANFIINFSSGSKRGEEKKIEIHKAQGNVVKDAVTLPKDTFRTLFVTDAKGKYVKDEKGRTQVKSPEDWEEFKNTIGARYKIDPGSIITYDQLLTIPEGPTPKWNVVIFPAGHGDRAANRLDVINSFLMFH